MIVFRTALMNPFTLEKVQDDKDYIDLFLEELPGLLQQAQAALRMFSAAEGYMANPPPR